MTPIDLIFGLIILVLVITLPGYFLTLAFFPKKEEIDSIERLTFSLVFSISFLPLLVLIENQLFSIPIDYSSAFGSLIALIVLGFVIWMIRTERIPVPSPLYGIFPKVKKEESVDLIFTRLLTKK
ncbi:MAG: DUF1616 domain-containing protein [archaeon]|nr:DUF1616 domain-containing protein [Candidatus Micrarchaeota archaeon]